MNFARETFNKSERLRSIKIIESLFENGEIFFSPHLKVVWQKSADPLPYPAQIAFSVPKKRFRFAVIRNLIRRRMREAYRKNKQFLYEDLSALNTQIVFAVIFRGDNIPDYITIEKSLKEMIKELIRHIKENDQKR